MAIIHFKNPQGKNIIVDGKKNMINPLTILFLKWDQRKWVAFGLLNKILYLLR